MNLSISGWSLYNNPYYTGQSSRNSNSVSELNNSNSTSGDTLTLSGAFSERLAAAVQNASNNSNSNTGQSSGSGQMMPLPPSPPMQAGTDSETDSVLMEQRAENLETAYNEVSTLDPENMTEEEIDAALANIKAVLETGDANSVTEAEAEAGRAAGFDLSALDDLAGLSLEEKQEVLSNLQTEIIDKYERMNQFEAGETQNGPAVPAGTGGPPPGGPPPSEADSELMEQRAINLETAYNYVSELEPESMEDTEALKDAISYIQTVLENGGANTATEAEEDIGLESAFDFSALEDLDSMTDVDELQSLLTSLKDQIVDVYANLSQMQAGSGAGMGDDQTEFQGNAMSQVNINGISGSLLSALWNVYGQQQSNTIAGADVLNQI